MDDSGLTTYLAAVATGVMTVALILAAVAWWVPKPTVRIAIGLGLVMLRLLSAALSLGAFVLRELLIPRRFAGLEMEEGVTKGSGSWSEGMKWTCQGPRLLDIKPPFRSPAERLTQGSQCKNSQS